MSRRGLVDDLSQKVLEAGDDLGIRGEIGVHNVAVQARQLRGWMTRERKEHDKRAAGRAISRKTVREARGQPGRK